MATQTKRRKKVTKNLDKGIVHIQATKHNTIVTITDEAGNEISWCSAGKLGFKGSRKGTPFVAGQAAEVAAKADTTLVDASIQTARTAETIFFVVLIDIIPP